MDLPLPVLPHPQRSFGPGEPRVGAAAGRRDGGEHAAGFRIDLLDAIVGELKQVAAVERGSCACNDFDRAHRGPALGIQGIQFVSTGEPDVLTVICDAVDVIDSRKWSILTNDLCW